MSRDRSVSELPPKKVIAILQSNYVPWKGYFDIIGIVDEFILYDNMQYTRSDWRNRNLFKTPNGLKWLTIPVKINGWLQEGRTINAMEIDDLEWNKKHWGFIQSNYSKAPFYKAYKNHLYDLYMGCKETYLSKINYRFIKNICAMLGIKTDISWSTDYRLINGKTERLVSLCEQAHATVYLSGGAAEAYLDEQLFEKAGVEVQYMDYSGYPEYEQLYPPFTHGVSVLDLILSKGKDAPSFMKFKQYRRLE